MNTNLENGFLFASLRVKRRLVLQHRDQHAQESIEGRAVLLRVGGRQLSSNHIASCSFRRR